MPSKPANRPAMPKIEAVEPKNGDPQELQDLKARLQENTELLHKMAERQEELERQLLEEKEKSHKIAAEAQKQGAGWLISVPSPIYDEKTLGVQFKNGVAWVGEDWVFPEFQVRPPNEIEIKTQVAQVKLETGDQAKADAFETNLRERAQMSTARRLVEQLEKDFGYKVTYYDGKDPETIKRVLDERAVQAKEAEEVIRKAREAGEALTTAMLVR